MPTPKSVVKFKNDHVEYVSEVDKAEYLIYELTRAALRDCGKLIVRRFRESFYSHFKRRTGDAGRATRYKVYSNKNTLYPRVDIGFKSGKSTGFYAYFQEFGANFKKLNHPPIPKLGLFRKSAEDNLAELLKIQEVYLGKLNEDDSACERLINEEEMEGDADELD